jgi:putative oxidoreductase
MQSYEGRSLKLWMACAILATVFVLAALPKLLGIDAMSEAFVEWNYPPEFMYVIGLMEIAGALAILVPAAARAGFAILLFVMCGAVVTHVIAGEIAAAVIPLGLGVFTAVVMVRDRREQQGLQVPVAT